MFQNPMQILNLLQNNANPMAMMNQMFGNNPIFQQVMQMTQGKNPMQIQQKQCCCEINRSIDAVRAENYKNTCDITNAIHAEGEATRALINHNTMQNLRDKLADKDRDLQTANFQLSQQAQSANIIGTLRPYPQPAYITCSPYVASNFGWGCGNFGCGCGCA